MQDLPVVTISKADIDAWARAGAQPLPMALAMAWARYAPRAKGAVPRTIGRWLGRGMRATIRTRHGGIIAVDPDNLDIYVFVALNNGYWEDRIHEVCNAVARPGNVVYDIGANAGLISIDLAAHLKGDLTCFAFEPIPSLARTVALSAALSGFAERFTVCEAMLGSAAGEATLFIPHHAIHASIRSREAGATPLKRRVFRLDDLVASGTIPPPDFIKIDVEGAELEVFRGALETLRTRRPIIVFESDQNMARFGYTRRELFELLASATPYTFYHMTDAALEPFTDFDHYADEDSNNFLALPPGVPLPALPPTSRTNILREPAP